MNELTSRSVHSFCTVSISLLEVGRDVTRNIYEDGIVEFQVQQTRDCFVQPLIAYIVMLKFVQVAVQRTVLIGILKKW